MRIEYTIKEIEVFAKGVKRILDQFVGDRISPAQTEAMRGAVIQYQIALERAGLYRYAPDVTMNLYEDMGSLDVKIAEYYDPYETEGMPEGTKCRVIRQQPTSSPHEVWGLRTIDQRRTRIPGWGFNNGETL